VGPGAHHEHPAPPQHEKPGGGPERLADESTTGHRQDGDGLIRPKRRRTVRDRWVAEVWSSRAIKDGCRVLMLLLAEDMTESGYAAAVAREEWAERLGIAPRRVTERITEATKAGLLTKVGGGYNGQTARYAAQLPDMKVADIAPPSKVADVPPPSARRWRESRHLQPPPSTASEPDEGGGQVAPIRARATTDASRVPTPAPDGDGRAPVPSSSRGEAVDDGRDRRTDHNGGGGPDPAGSTSRVRIIAPDDALAVLAKVDEMREAGASSEEIERLLREAATG
jgi:DNA-binding Lrp family transcriptional regulator